MSKYNYSLEDFNEVKSFLIGSKLGDGSFIKRTPNHNVYIQFKHAENQYEYLLWKYETMKKFIKTPIKQRKWKENEKKLTWQEQYYFSTVSCELFNIIYDFDKINLINNLDQTAFVVWLMDDGNYYKGTWKLSTPKFSIKEMTILLRILKGKLNLNGFYYVHPKRDNANYIRLLTSQNPLLNKMILDVIPPNLDIVKYKLGVGLDNDKSRKHLSL